MFIYATICECVKRKPSVLVNSCEYYDASKEVRSSYIRGVLGV